MIELLTVIGIVGILAALVLSITSRVRKSVEAARCTENLRQLGQALMLYAGDNRRELPPGLVWDRKVAPYLSVTLATAIGETPASPLFVCPSDERELSSRPRSYAASARSNSIAGIGVFSRNTTDASLRMENLDMPAKTVLLCEIFTRGYAESRQFGTSFAIVDGWLGGTGPRLADGSHYHSSGQNYVFADGHVERLSVEEIMQGSIHGGRWRAHR